MRSLPELVAVPEELVAAADREHDGAVVHRLRESGSLGRDEVARDDPLVAVLAASQIDEVMGPGVQRLAWPGGDIREPEPSPFAAPPQEQDVAPVGVDVHLLRVERHHAELHHALLPITTVAPRYPSVGGTSTRFAVRSPARMASSSSVSASRPSRRSTWSSSLSAPFGATV